MKIRTQDYAKVAYPLVEKIHCNDASNVEAKTLEKKYRTLALTFPTMIMQSGLSQAVGFLMAKGGEEHLRLLDHLATLMSATDGETLHKNILESSMIHYQLLTRRSLEATAWLKRYTQALLEKEQVRNE